MLGVVKRWDAPGGTAVWTTAREGHLASAWNERPSQWLELHQTHGSGVVDAAGVESGVDADASFTVDDDVVLGIKTADCAPLAIIGNSGVVAVHAGWAGIVAGVVSEAVDALRRVDKGDLRAGLGPCIRACCYEFGGGDMDSVARAVGSDVSARTRTGGLSLDMVSAVRNQLAAKGVALDYVDPDCTACTSDYFSYRTTGTKDRQVMFVQRT